VDETIPIQENPKAAIKTDPNKLKMKRENQKYTSNLERNKTKENKRKEKKRSFLCEIRIDRPSSTEAQYPQYASPSTNGILAFNFSFPHDKQS